MADPIIDVALLGALLEAREPMSIDAIALGLGRSREAVARELVRLRASGCLLDEHPQHGVRLRESGLSAWQDYLAHRSPRPRRVAVYRRTASTQDICRQLIASHGRAADGAIAVADEQTAGRGRLGRRWLAPPGRALTFSRACLSDDRPADATVDRLTFATSVALAEAAEALLDRAARVTVKWPNDVCVDGRKLAGILVETSTIDGGGRAAVVGVGFNVGLTVDDLPADEPALRGRVTSLAMLGRPLDRLLVLDRLVRAMDDALEQDDADDLLDRWRQRCTMLHQHVTLISGGRHVAGQVVDLDPHAGLIVRLDAGELVHLPAATTRVAVDGR